MNEKDPFIIEDLDEYHLIIKADEEYRVRRELEAEVRTSSSLKRHPFSEPLILFSWKRIRTVWKPVNDHCYIKARIRFVRCSNGHAETFSSSPAIRPAYLEREAATLLMNRKDEIS